MYEHRCSEGHPGGFFSRVKHGTWMGHVIEHIALEIQTLAGMDCGFGRTRSTGELGVYNVVFNYMEEKVGIYAAKASVRIAQALIDSEAYDLAKDIQTMREIREDERLGPSTGSIVEEAVARKIPWIRLNRHSLVQLGYGMNQRRIQATVASTTSNIAVEIACDKEETKNLLEASSIPVPRGLVVYDEEDLEVAAIGKKQNTFLSAFLPYEKIKEGNKIKIFISSSLLDQNLEKNLTYSLTVIPKNEPHLIEDREHFFHFSP
jgi:cyanophycin synthetase